MAVYTDVSAEDLDGFLKAYDLGAARAFKGIAEGVENSNYFLATDAGAFILTLYEKRVAAGDLPYFMGLLDHLSDKGLPVATPVHGRDGTAVRRLNGRPAAILRFLDGVSLKRPQRAHCAAAGAALARLHLAGADFVGERANALSLDGWRGLIGRIGDRGETVSAGIAALIEDEMAAMAAAWPAGLPRGQIHADLFPDNTLFLGERLTGLIDFYFACTDLLAYDLAVCLNAWCFEADASFNLTKGRAMVAAYRAVRPLSGDEAAALPVLCRGAALRFLLTRLLDWIERDPNALVRPKNPMEYVEKLRFHRAAVGPEDYGWTA